MRIVVLGVAGVLAFGCAAPPHAAPHRAGPHAAPPLTLERILSSPSLTGSSPSSPAWSPDSKLLAFRWRAPRDSSREVWLVDRDGAGLRRLARPATGAEGPAGVREFVWLPDGSGILQLRAGELWRTGLDGACTRLAEFTGGASGLGVAPNGRYASLLRAGDLWLVELSSGERTRATEVAQPSISKVPFGRYRRREVEIGSYVWGGPTYAWAPDGRSIAVHYVDRRGVRRVPFPHYLGEETDPNFVRRGYPGDPNELRTVGLLQVDTRRLDLLELAEPTERRIVDFSWSKDGLLLIDRDSDTAVDRWLHVFDPETRELREVWHDRRETRVYTSAGSAWHPDGKHVILLGDLADRYGLYSLHLDEPQPTPRRLTRPEFDVLGGPFVTDSGAIFCSCNQPNPYESQVVRTALGGQSPNRVTRLAGQMRPYPSPDGKRVALLHSADASPTELYLASASGSEVEQRITHSRPPEFAEREWAKPRYVTFPSLVDDATLHARILEPANMDPARRYPVIFGPVYSNTVRNRWAGFYGLLQQVLVDKGFVVVQVDVRGSTGYGRPFREQFLNDFAGRDLEDLASAVAYLEGLPHIDPDRIGIWGSSYGGTLTAYALLKKPGLFDAGVACAAAVDPRFFGSDDVAIVRRPDSHPAAFQRGAAQFAGNLEDPLLLIHGMQDQVVPFKTVVDLAEELMRQGKDFDFAFAPSGTHGWTGRPHHARYLLGKLIAHFERHLGDAPR